MDAKDGVQVAGGATVSEVSSTVSAHCFWGLCAAAAACSKTHTNDTQLLAGGRLQSPPHVPPWRRKETKKAIPLMFPTTTTTTKRVLREIDKFWRHDGSRGGFATADCVEFCSVSFPFLGSAYSRSIVTSRDAFETVATSLAVFPCWDPQKFEFETATSYHRHSTKLLLG